MQHQMSAAWKNPMQDCIMKRVLHEKSPRSIKCSMPGCILKKVQHEISGRVKYEKCTA